MIKRLSKRERLLILTAVLSGVLLIYNRYFLSPIIDEVCMVRYGIKNNEQRLVYLTEGIKGMDYSRVAIEELEAKIRAMMVMVPLSPRTPDIVAKLEDYADAAEVNLGSIMFNVDFVTGTGEGAAEKGMGYQKIPVHVEVSGVYKNILMFLEALESADRIYDINGFNIYSAGSGDDGTVYMSIDLNAYSLKPEGLGTLPDEEYSFIGECCGIDDPFAPAAR